jgi:probable rRNA maturation factor
MHTSRIEIELQIDNAYVDRVDGQVLVRAAAAALEHQEVAGPAELTIVIATDEELHRLNRTYREVDESTDVLAFGDVETDGFVNPPDAPRYLGDVIISFPRAEKQAQRAGHPVEAELQLLSVHGVLHLLGYDHADPAERAAMWAAQAETLRQLGAPVADPTPEST